MTKIINRKLFISLLDWEIKKAKRYNNYFSILRLKLSPLPGFENEDRSKTCWKNLRDLLVEELREGDIFSSLGNDQWVVFIPYANFSDIGCLRSRLMANLEFRDFKKRGYDIMAEPICFPQDGTTAADLYKKLKDHGRSNPDIPLTLTSI